MGVNINQQQTADWDELEYVLTERQKPALLVCSFDTLTSKAQSIAEFQQRFPQFTQHEIDSTGERVVSLFRYLKEKLPELAEAETGNIQHLIHLSGLEYSLMAEAPASPGQLLPELNFERELVFRDLPCILVIWVNQYTLKRLQKEAPDFWDWVQYRYHFSSPPELVDRRPVAYVAPLQSKGFTPERLARVEEMEARYNRLDQSGDNREQTLQNMANLLETLGRECLEIFEGEKALDYFTSLLAVRERLGDQFEMAAAHFYLGEANRIARQLERAVQNYAKSVSLFDKVDGLDNVAVNYHQIGMVHQEQRDWDKALLNYHKAIEWKEKTQQRHELDVTYASIGLVHKVRGQTDEAKTQLQKALSLAEQYDTGLRDYIQKELDEV